MSGPQVYNTACLACHGPGIGGAPIFGDAAAWAPRIAKGIEALNEHALNGFTDVGYMPPKGGRVDLSDPEILDAVAYMVAEVQ
jgi:cytochrome c